MVNDISKLLEDIHGLQEQLEQFFEEARGKFRYTLEDGRVRFSREVRQLQRRCPQFFAFGDAQGYQKGLHSRRQALKEE